MTDYLRFRNQIESHLYRSLEEDELIGVPSLDHLSPRHLSVVETLARRHRLAALLYLRAVVEGVTGDDALALIDKIRDTPVRGGNDRD
jgi:hypothetical protein